MAPMLKEMIRKFDRYWSDYSVFLSCAAILDPRIKLGFICYCYNKFYPDDAQRKIDEVKATLANLFEEYRGTSVPATSSNVGARHSSGGDVDLFDDYEQFMASSQTHEHKSRLDLYLYEPPRHMTEELDVLDYWKKSSMQYPELARMARDVLDVPVFSVASESAFSMSRKLITPNRFSLKPKTIEALMCLQDWYHSKVQEREGTSNTVGAGSSNVASHVEDVFSDSE